MIMFPCSPSPWDVLHIYPCSLVVFTGVQAMVVVLCSRLNKNKNIYIFFNVSVVLFFINVELTCERLIRFDVQ